MFNFELKKIQNLNFLFIQNTGSKIAFSTKALNNSNTEYP